MKVIIFNLNKILLILVIDKHKNNKNYKKINSLINFKEFINYKINLINNLKYY